MKVLVSGGAGLLGSAVARRLLQAGWSVAVADAFAADTEGRAARGGRAAVLKEGGATIRRLDLGEAPAVQELLEEIRPDVVVNAARLPADADVQPLAGVGAAIGVSLLVHVSDSDLYGAPPLPGVRAREDEPLAPGNDPRLLARVRDEELVRGSGVPFVIFRAFELVSEDLRPGTPLRDFADLVLGGQVVPLPDEEGRDFLHADDAARAIHLAITRRPAGTTLNLGSGTGMSLRSLAAEIARGAGLAEPAFQAAAGPARPPRVADTTAAWESLRFGPEIPFPRVAAALASAYSASATSRPAPGPPPATATIAVSRREMFGIFRKPFDRKK